MALRAQRTAALDRHSAVVAFLVVPMWPWLRDSSGAAQKTEDPRSRLTPGVSSGDTRTRTKDTGIMIPLLYQLSYTADGRKIDTSPRCCHEVPRAFALVCTDTRWFYLCLLAQ